MDTFLSQIRKAFKSKFSRKWAQLVSQKLLTAQWNPPNHVENLVAELRGKVRYMLHSVLSYLYESIGHTLTFKFLQCFLFCLCFDRLFQLQELRGNIRVFCRCRPDNNGTLAVEFPSSTEVQLRNQQGQMRLFEFERVFTPSSTQEDVSSLRVAPWEYSFTCEGCLMVVSLLFPTSMRFSQVNNSKQRLYSNVLVYSSIEQFKADCCFTKLKNQ